MIRTLRTRLKEVEKRRTRTEPPVPALTTEEARREILRMTSEILGFDASTLSAEEYQAVVEEIGDELERRCGPDGEWLPGHDPHGEEQP